MTYRRPLPPKDSVPFSFERFGRTYHFKIQTTEDLQKVLLLDEAHWVATSAPIKTINADPVFLQFMDFNQDGRIRAEEVQAAIGWILDHLSDVSQIRPGNFQLQLAAVKPEALDGGRILEAARKILHRLGQPDAGTISLDAVRHIKKQEEEGGLDKPGMVLASAADRLELVEFLNDIVATVGGQPHPSGAQGITVEQLKFFLSECRTYWQWLEQADLPDPASVSPIMPLGAKTDAAYELFSVLREKFDQFFALSSLIRLHPWMADQIRPAPQTVEILDLSNSTQLEEFIADAPLAWPTAQPLFDFGVAINPRYAVTVRKFQSEVLPLIVREVPAQLTSDQWDLVKQTFAEHQRWCAAKPDATVSALSAAKIKRYLFDPRFQQGTEQLLEESHRTAFDLDSVRLLEKIILFQSNLLTFVNSFVSFPDLYDPTRRALFEMGTLIMDGRNFTLSVKVLDRGQHAKFSDASNMFMLYVEISDKEGEKLYEVAVPVTSGDRGNLQVNKWGIFHDLEGKERHAQVVQIVENPISLSEAMVAPFKKLGAAVAARFGERASKAEAQLVGVGTGAMEPAALSAPKPPAPAGPAAPAPTSYLDPRVAGSALAGGGIAIAALGSSAAFITSTVSKLTWEARLWGLFGASMAVLLPVTVVAVIRLSKRDLSALLEGSGWAINARMRLTAKQARAFTFKPSFPLWSIGIAVSKAWLWCLVFLAAAALVLLGIAKLTPIPSWLAGKAAITNSVSATNSLSNRVSSLPIAAPPQPTNTIIR